MKLEAVVTSCAMKNLLGSRLCRRHFVSMDVFRYLCQISWPSSLEYVMARCAMNIPKEAVGHRALQVAPFGTDIRRREI